MGSDEDNPGQGNENGEERKERTTAEWVTLAVSILIVLALAMLVLFQYVAQGTRPPEIEIKPLQQETRHIGDKYYLPISVTNNGEKAVESVEVELELTVSGEEPETVAFNIPFLAGLGSDEYTVVLSSDPQAGELAYTISFREP